MKKLIIMTVALLLSATSFAQCLSVINGSKSFPFPPDRYNTYFYIDGSLDVLNAFDKNDTNNEVRGLDFDVEMGQRKDFLAVYAYYGEFNNMDYKNFGLGLDLYLYESRTLDIAFGPSIGGIHVGGGVTHFAYALRFKPILAMTDAVAVYSKLQFQQRPDLVDEHGIFEVAAGIQFKIF